METNQFVRRMIMAASLTLLAGVPALPTEAADQSSGKSTPSASTAGLGIAASDAVGDTLKACLARIPKDSSAGQRTIAEQGCGRDEGNRKLIQAVPGH